MPTAYVLARQAVSISRPESALFLEPDVYEWRARYELSIAAWYVGAIEEGRVATQALLSNADVPEPERQAILRNKAYYD